MDFLPTHIQETIVSMTMKAIELFTHLSIFFKELYKTNFIVKNVCDMIFDLYYLMKVMMTEHILEPNSFAWTCISHIEDNSYQEHYITMKSYSDDIDIKDESTVKKIEIDLNTTYKDAKETNQREKSEFLVNLKIDQCYLSRICLKKRDEMTPFSMNKTEKQFLSIEYFHLEMDKPVILDIPRGYYMEGNEILSPMFVLRYLKYNCDSYVYDSKYKLKIMDNNINNVELDNTQYVLLEKEGYKIMKL